MTLICPLNEPAKNKRNYTLIRNRCKGENVTKSSLMDLLGILSIVHVPKLPEILVETQIK